MVLNWIMFMHKTAVIGKIFKDFFSNLTIFQHNSTAYSTVNSGKNNGTDFAIRNELYIKAEVGNLSKNNLLTHIC